MQKLGLEAGRGDRGGDGGRAETGLYGGTYRFIGWQFQRMRSAPGLTPISNKVASKTDLVPDPGSRRTHSLFIRSRATVAGETVWCGELLDFYWRVGSCPRSLAGTKRRPHGHQVFPINHSYARIRAKIQQAGVGAGRQPTQGSMPRLIGPNRGGQLLYAANEGGDTVVTFPDGRRLRQAGSDRPMECEPRLDRVFAGTT